ncbi:hypothetical protein L0337_05445, partial [candidate division KSB1 bacterium]|nr:hypothetical protein [candidate division KSB1 bacterium]
ATDKKLYPLSRRGGISIRWEKLALFVKVIGHQNLSIHPKGGVRSASNLIVSSWNDLFCCQAQCL